ncbi:PEP-CTERM sorting domain-containing protein [Rubinisphaera brasiliensis]|uniref:PEP motif putative anchor domain protein n=1 Tax=Rubinisphaera brasiliensis (strain ATCC 49424 / DSM 5305 / JCM 21570 / IAM 15109 / NBRC 103401 / IFAM 1448) TaxID=756272 RepID=F0SI81_RUBBR|nr:PEP-CTERM sorting domain-containing protein [Rubinisphaera brasiliensis]ADY61783.1 PEP motif putative anchor domain protein [Rubinisphaera brasiliensis DSM 5305]
MRANLSTRTAWNLHLVGGGVRQFATFLIVFVTGFSTLGSTSLVEAGVISNGGFESPLAGDWTVVGTASSALLAGATPTEGSQYAFLNTIGGDPSVAAIENTLGLTPGTLTGAQGGAAIYQDVTLNAGETLSFDWRFLSELSDNSLANDFAFWSLTPNGIPGGYTQLADTFDVGADPVGTFDYSTSDFSPAASSLIASDGTYRLGFGVMNYGNNLDAFPSGLLIDNISISGSSPAAVPEPGTLAMLGISTLGFGMGYVRKRKKITGSTDPSKESMI